MGSKRERKREKFWVSGSMKGQGVSRAASKMIRNLQRSVWLWSKNLSPSDLPGDPGSETSRPLDPVTNPL